VKPLTLLPAHEFVKVDPALTTGDYKVKFCGDTTYTCNCPVWRYQNRAVNERTCKHLQMFLGDEYERKRCNLGGDGGGGGAARLPGVMPDRGMKAPPVVGAGAATAGAAAIPGKRPMPGVLLANKANWPEGKTDYTGWWVSEKLDGVRAYWDGTYLMSRNGNTFHAPAWFTSGLPKDQTLDGELFAGRKQFQKATGIVKSSDTHPGWRSLKYCIFDIPSADREPFEARMERLKRLFPEGGDPPTTPSHVEVVKQERCRGAAHLKTEFERIQALKGEGLMLRQPGSTYAHTRSNTLLKIKGFEDVEAKVVGYDAGKGKHEGRTGALRCRLANGKEFCVGSGMTDADRAKPVAIGTVVTVRYQELTDGGIPRFPVYVGPRYDIDWPPKA